MCVCACAETVDLGGLAATAVLHKEKICRKEAEYEEETEAS